MLSRNALRVSFCAEWLICSALSRVGKRRGISNPTGDDGVRRVGVLLQQFLHLVVDVLGGEAEFLVEDLVRSGEAEAFEAPDSAIVANKSL